MSAERKSYASLIAHCAALLLAVACRNHVYRNVSTAMADDLTVMRKAIGEYYSKHHSYPHTLHELVRDGELRRLPVDPITRSSITWRPTLQENVRTDDFSSTAQSTAPPEIVDVHSGATGTDDNGRPWSDY